MIATCKFKTLSNNQLIMPASLVYMCNFVSWDDKSFDILIS